MTTPIADVSNAVAGEAITNINAASAFTDPDTNSAFNQLTYSLPDVDSIAVKPGLNGKMVDLSSPAKPFSPLLAQAHRLYQEGRFRESLEMLQPALRQPAEDVPQAALRLGGACLYSLGQAAQAVRLFEMATQKAGEVTADDWLNLASALDEAKEWDKAEAVYEAVLQLKPGLTVARLQWCALLRTLGRQDQAEAELAAALRALPETAPAKERALLLHAQGVVAHELGGYESARPFMEEALALHPDFPEAHYHLAMAALARGENEMGWSEFEWRWGQSQADKSWRAFGEGPPQLGGLAAAPGQRERAPLWRGEPLGEASLLVWEEQGLGDNLQFFRYMALLRAREPKAALLFWCRSTLHPVLAAWAREHRIQLLPAEQLRVEQVRGQEWHVPLMSLPFCLQEYAYPPVAGTVRAPVGRLSVWRDRMARYRDVPGGPPLQVGLVWSGTQVQTMSTRRNLQLQHLNSWLATPGIQWHSLQVGPRAGDIALSDWQGRIVDWSHHLKDFGETAALAEQLDLVISVDTSTAHLAASLNRPTWVLSRFDACWRWLLGREDSPWYPSLRLFRQPRPFDWDSVVDKVAARLENLVTEGGQA